MARLVQWELANRLQRRAQSYLRNRRSGWLDTLATRNRNLPLPEGAYHSGERSPKGRGAIGGASVSRKQLPST